MYPLLHIDGKLTISSKEWCLVKWTTKSRRESNRIFIDSNVCFGVFVQASRDRCSWEPRHSLHTQLINAVEWKWMIWIRGSRKEILLDLHHVLAEFGIIVFVGVKNGCSSNHPILCFKDYHFCLSASWVSGKMWPTPSMANVQWWHVRNLYSYGRLVVMEGRLFHCCGNVVFVRSLYQQWKSIEYLIIYQCLPLINQWVYKWIAFKLSIGMIMWICWI